MLGSLLGGVGLFMLGMQLMTDGLKIAAGHTLRNILQKSTRTAIRGLLSGAFITSLVQSSSAITVATIGFVNAGLMNLRQAITITYGSNIGTTMTGWLVALVGFQFHIKVFALPLIGFGMLIRLIKGNSRYGALGLALAGFGVFFIGIDILKDAFAGLGETIDLAELGGGGLIGHAIFIGIGFLLTLAMQSSSAAMAIALTAAAGGIIPLDNAAAVVIGANIGTTSTAALAVIGATPNAKRVAAAHVIFNMATGVIALLILPLLLQLLLSLPGNLHLNISITTLLALFHTIFNLLGVFLMWPFTDKLGAYLKTLFRTAEEDEAHLVYLDNNLVHMPVLAFHALAEELKRLGIIARRMAKGAISSEAGPSRLLESDQRVLLKLEIKIGKFINEVRRGGLPEKLDHALPHALRITSYYREVADVAIRIAQMQQGKPVEDEKLALEISLYKQNVVRLLDATDVGQAEFSLQACNSYFEELEGEYKHLKNLLLKAGTKDELPVTQMVTQIDLMSDIRRIAGQMEKAACYLVSMTTAEVESQELPPEEEAA
ncbi:MAG: Na/Pi symporter [Desulfobulbaceae bacterium]|nr:Na/Pi symporter [Desulfobulbaceae bacterium]HIJ78220.1 Na/Pi cotransporter family protein [Deltaproteobacteria bacterium]